MSKDIRIKKGLNINLVGAAEPTTSKAVLSNVYSINLQDFRDNPEDGCQGGCRS